MTDLARDAKTAIRFLFHTGPLQDAIALIPVDERPGVLDRLVLLRTRCEYVESILAVEVQKGNSHPPQEPQDQDDLLTPEQAAAMLGLTVAQLKRRRAIPRKSLGRRTIRFSRKALDGWLKTRR